MESALGWGEPLPPWPHDHFRQINWMAPRSATIGVIASYRNLVERLADIEPSHLKRVYVGQSLSLMTGL
jgi:hypothetical protein